MDPVMLLLSCILMFTASKAELFTNEDQHSNVDMGLCSQPDEPDECLMVDKIRPIRYTMKFIVNPVLANIVGETNIMITVDYPMADIGLHAYGLRIQKSSIKLRNANSIAPYALLGYRYCRGRQFLDLRFDRTMDPGDYNLTMKFTAPFSGQKGMLRHEYRTNRKLTSRMFTTLFEPNAARRLFPCWDQPGIKANFSIAVEHPKEYRVLSNMPITAQHDYEGSSGDLRWTHFDDTSPISASQVAIILIETDLKDSVINNMDRVWHQPGVEKSLSDVFSAITKARIFWYTIMVHASKIFPKIDYILFPNNTINAMDCVGLMIHREKDLLYDAQLDFPGRKYAIMKIIGYKMARQWFIGAVTPFCWSALWLGESLATLYGHYTLDKFSETPMSLDLFVVQILQPTLRQDINLRMKTISEHNVHNADEINAIFYSRLYSNKATGLMRMLEHLLTQNTFELAVKNYLKTYEMGMTTEDNFWNILQSAYDQQSDKKYTIKEIMKSWLTQNHYPVLYVNNDRIAREIKLKAVGANNYVSKWIIPVTCTMQLYRNKVSISNVTWINSSEITNIRLPINYDLVIINASQSGYYRVNYDRICWLQIATYLNYRDYERIHVLNRAQFIDDAYYFLMKDEMQPSMFWEIVRYLRRETNYVAWYPMFNILSYISPYWDHPESSYVKPIALEILDGLIDNIGYLENSYESDMTKSLRLLGVRWACKLGHTNCILAANEKLVAHLDDPNEHEILPWWKNWVYCTGLMTADKTTWNKLLANYAATKNSDILKYLYCSEDEDIILNYLNILLSDNFGGVALSDKEFTNLYRAFVKRHVRKNVVLKEILRRYHEKRYRWQNETGDIDMLGDMIMNVHDDTHFNKIVKFAKSQADVLSLDLLGVHLIKQAQKERIANLHMMFVKL